jgi:hypothetical protein
MTFIRTRRIVATIATASCIAVATTASASAGSLPPTYKSDAAQAISAGSLRSGDRGDAAQSGWAAASAFTPADFHGGDTPADHPGASRAPTAAPTTIEVVRLERTIVHDVDEALPLILTGTTLLLVIASLGITLVRTRIEPRPSRGH